MKKEISLKLLPNEINDDTFIEERVREELNIDQAEVLNIRKIKCSLDARKQPIKYLMKLEVGVDESLGDETEEFIFKDVHNKEALYIIGAGPAGLFCALECLELGLKPIIIERGKRVRDRRRDLAKLNKEGVLNEESNYCFGEGGAGTYSDGKLYTRSKKRGSVAKMLKLFVQFGADEKILWQAHPHIGTNKLPSIIESIREKILECGGQIEFESKLTDIIIKDDSIRGFEVNHTKTYDCKRLVLATGHSARDVYSLLAKRKVALEFKSFALGIRIEHPQDLINTIQYGKEYARAINLNLEHALPPAAYSISQQVNGNALFSFCMCPGGIIAPASTEQNHLVVNGWSPSKRNNPYANSGMVVGVNEEQLDSKDVFSGIKFQSAIEEKAFLVGGGKFKAPAQRLTDFLSKNASSSVPENSYLPGTTAASMDDILPKYICQTLRLGLKQYGRRMKSYISKEAVLIATESRTSSPLRIPRDRESLEHTQVKGLYPCAEGAGYAGGIISAGIDGQRIAKMAFVK